MKAFVDARIINGETGTLSPDSVILVGDNGRIEAVGGAELPVDRREVVGCGGKIIYPGLIDMHFHLQEECLPQLIDHGVTTVRDVGNDLERVLGYRRKTASGALRGPRVHCAGPLLDGAKRPMWPEHSVPVADGDEARRAVVQLADAGVDGIKLYMGIEPPLLPPIAEAAHGRGLPVTAHLGASSCIEAARAGVNSLEHACQGLYNALVPPEDFLVWDLRWTLGQSRYFAGFYRGWAKVDPDAPRVQEVLEELRDRSVALDPTLLVNRRIAEWALDPEPLRELVSDVAPAVSAEWVSKADWFVADWSKEDTAVAFDALDVVGAVVARFVKIGGTLVVGTDAPFSFLVPGVSLHEELQLLVRSGLSNAEVLRAATGAAARVLGWQADVGALVPGRLADFVVCAGDPLTSIADTAKIAVVYKGGERVAVATAN